MKIKFEDFISWLMVFMITIFPMIFSLRLPERFSLPKLIVMYMVISILLVLNLLYNKPLIINYKLKNNKLVFFLVFIYIGMTAISSIFALDPKLALAGGFESTIVIFFYVVLFLYTYQWYEYSDKHFKLFMVSSSAICLYGIFQKFGLDFLPIYESRSIEQLMYSTIGNPNSLGAFISLSFFVVVFNAIKNNKKLLYILSIIQFFALLCTQSMASWLGTFIGYFVLFLLIVKYKNKDILRNYIKISIVFLIVTIIYELMFQSVLTELGIFVIDIESVINSDNFSAGRYRMMAWKISIVLIAGSPLIGYGPECMNLAVKSFINYDKYPKHNFIDILNRAHNVYLHTMVSSGIIAGISQILLILKAIYNGLLKERLNYITALICSVTAYFVQSNFSANVISVAPVFWIFIAVLLKE